MPAIVIIPARFGSTRFPGKPLCRLKGRYMIEHVYERVKKAKKVHDVYIATDSILVEDAVKEFGGKVIMTSDRHSSGTDRIAEAINKIDDLKIHESDIIVNVQGDEPMIEPDMVDEVIDLMDDKRASIGTLVKKIENIEEVFDPNIVKVVFDENGYAFYFSRSPIPYSRDFFQVIKDKDLCSLFCIKRPEIDIFKHIGIYAFRKEALILFSNSITSRLEAIEKLEQLRALELGLKIKVKETFFETIGVDTPDDLEKVERCLSLSL
jgi:3-deoxy-manno-octulosonate cytidylyltransferase (CMP-KDO synthetase)